MGEVLFSSEAFCSLMLYYDDVIFSFTRNKLGQHLQGYRFEYRVGHGCLWILTSVELIW